MLAGNARFERALICARTGEGQEACEGPWGEMRPSPEAECLQRQEALQRLAAGETQTDIVRSYGVSHVTIGRLQGPVLRPFDGAGAPAG
jgi:DNA invertase Pin-like site-specific DNA recombinase